MRFTPLRIPEVLLIEPQSFSDERGAFMETWQASKFGSQGLKFTFVQDNQSESHPWVLRGLHYQLNHPQGKLVRVARGEVFDVAVDVRRSSPTFGEWVGHRLSAENRAMMWIPPGFAHGFLTLNEPVIFLYKCTDTYDAHSERSILWNDARLGIEWPLPSGVRPVLSRKDEMAVPFAQAECYP